MKVIDIQLGRKTSYAGTAARRAQPWQATLYAEALGGGTYPEEIVVPSEIAEKMAAAAHAVLVESGFFQPEFLTDVVPLPRSELEPEPKKAEGSDTRSVDEAISDSLADGG